MFGFKPVGLSLCLRAKRARFSSKSSCAFNVLVPPFAFFPGRCAGIESLLLHWGWVLCSDQSSRSGAEHIGVSGHAQPRRYESVPGNILRNRRDCATPEQL